MWGGITGTGHKIGPFFLEGTLTGAGYLELLQEEIIPQMKQVLGEELPKKKPRRGEKEEERRRKLVAKVFQSGQCPHLFCAECHLTISGETCPGTDRFNNTFNIY